MWDGEICDHCGIVLNKNQTLQPCVLCKEPLFCDQQCMFDGLAKHFEECTKKQEMIQQIEQRDHLTPRSVLHRVFVIIEKNEGLKLELFTLLKSCESEFQTIGCLVIRATTPQDICTLLNETYDPCKQIINMVMFESCSNLVKDERMEALVQMRICVANHGKNQLVLGIQTGKNNVLCRLFNIKSRRASVCLSENLISENLISESLKEVKGMK